MQIGVGKHKVRTPSGTCLTLVVFWNDQIESRARHRIAPNIPTPGHMSGCPRKCTQLCVGSAKCTTSIKIVCNKNFRISCQNT